MRLRDKFIKKGCGTLMAVSSLPSKDGIGTFGIEAYKFIDFLRITRQRYWQMLPIVCLGEGNSPYKSVSCFAGEPLYIDLNFLVRDGLLSPSHLKDMPNGKVDYKSVREYKLPLLKIAAQNFDVKRTDFKYFTVQNSFWLDDYSIFVTMQKQFNSEKIADFDENLRYRTPDSLSHFIDEHYYEIQECKIIQFLFFSQFYELSKYARKNGIMLIGDIPFYVAPDSADVWKNPECFEVGRDLAPSLIAGVPPDIFSKSGQLWGNPIYNWENQRKNDYLWWRMRLLFMSRHFDVIRIDHFRAFADYYAIPQDAPDAQSGQWVDGEDISFWDTVKKHLGALNIIAEDLGGEDSPKVKALLEKTGFPNMKILQFAFTGDPHNSFLPQNYPNRCVCYTGTHDNDTTLGWYKGADSKTLTVLKAYLPNVDEETVVFGMLELLAKSDAYMMIVPMQDWLSLDSSGRMNTPATKEGNWEWRLSYIPNDNDLLNQIKTISKRK